MLILAGKSPITQLWQYVAQKIRMHILTQRLQTDRNTTSRFKIDFDF